MRYFQPKLPLALLTAGLLVLSACGDSTTEPEEDHDEHAGEVEGVTLSLGGQTIASYDGHDGEWTGELGVESGGQTARISVQFVDDHGEAVEFDDDFHLRVEVADASIAAFDQDTPGAFGGVLRGVAAGNTTVTFSLVHGDVGTGHPDFITEPLAVNVR